MKYILNTGRYALSFEIEKGGLKKTIVLDRRRLYNDTGNVATTGVTAIEDDDYKLLSELEIFKKRFADKSCALSLKYTVSESRREPSVLVTCTPSFS